MSRQGCSKAVIGAVMPNTLLNAVDGDSLPKDFRKRFFDLQHSRTNGLWYVDAGADSGVLATINFVGRRIY